MHIVSRRLVHGFGRSYAPALALGARLAASTGKQHDEGSKHMDDFDEIQFANRTCLLVLINALRRHPAAACAMYELKPEGGTRIAALKLDEIEVFLISAGNTPLFLPRPELHLMLDLPKPLIAPMAYAWGAARQRSQALDQEPTP